MKILLPGATGLRQVLKQSILFDGQLVLVMKSIKFHCHKMTKMLLHSFNEMELGTAGSILRPTKITDFFIIFAMRLLMCFFYMRIDVIFLKKTFNAMPIAILDLK